MNQKYNGWHNWDTWNVNLWLTNDKSSYKDARFICRHTDAYSAVAAALDELAKYIIPAIEGINWNIVNYEEIYNNFVNEGI